MTFIKFAYSKDSHPTMCGNHMLAKIATLFMQYFLELLWLLTLVMSVLAFIDTQCMLLKHRSQWPDMHVGDPTYPCSWVSWVVWLFLIDQLMFFGSYTYDGKVTSSTNSAIYQSHNLMRCFELVASWFRSTAVWLFDMQQIATTQFNEICTH